MFKVKYILGVCSRLAYRWAEVPFDNWRAKFLDNEHCQPRNCWISFYG